ncbi:MAG TPA: DUF2937 family protein [Polyangiaceae bacterium]|jgi:hypothetical protein|nr:DUF2937 family protein [Polyangiaceae bacterium]
MRWSFLARPMLRFSEGLIDRLLCVLGAVSFTQVPEFIQQYLQRLGGHLDEARRQVEGFTKVAALSQLTARELIERTAQNPDEAVARLSSVMREAIERVEHLTAAEAAIRDASAWTRPFVFLAHMDPAIAGATWDVYRPAVPTTLEGVVYAGFGILVLWGLYYGLLRYPVTALLGRRRGAAATTPKPPP